MKNNKGFSLVEILIVVAIIAIMGGFMFLSLGLLSGQDAKECANNLSTVLDKEKNYALVKSTGETDCYVEIKKETDGYYARYYVPQSAVGTGTVCISEEKLGKSSVIINGCYDDNFGDTNPAVLKRGLTSGKTLKITYDRSSGAVKEVNLDGETDINVITIDKGRKYDIYFYIATGKHMMKRTD